MERNPYSWQVRRRAGSNGYFLTCLNVPSTATLTNRSTYIEVTEETERLCPVKKHFRGFLQSSKINAKFRVKGFSLSVRNVGTSKHRTSERWQNACKLWSTSRTREQFFYFVVPSLFYGYSTILLPKFKLSIYRRIIIGCSLRTSVSL
jgi:hypothetical protein